MLSWLCHVGTWTALLSEELTVELNIVQFSESISPCDKGDIDNTAGDGGAKYKLKVHLQ